MTDSAGTASSGAAREQMHSVYRAGGKAKQMAPHVIYRDAGCPHAACDQHLQAIDFRLEEYGQAIHDELVRAWWDDIGFAGKCPKCDGWIHFTIRDKRAIDEEAARGLPQLPTDWHEKATILYSK